jgi:hypothetical protein
VVNWDGVFKPGGKPEGDHAMHFKGWIERPMTEVQSKNVHMQMI